MKNIEIITLLYSSISVLGLCIFWFWFYRDYCIDRFRQEIFAIRDSLFDFAANGGIAFDHPAYGMLRSTMNGFIRFARLLTLSRFVALGIAVRKDIKKLSKNSFQARWQKNITDLTTEQITHLENVHKEMNFLVARHLIRSSPILVLLAGIPLAIFGIIATILFAFDKFIQFFQVLKSQIDNLDSVALENG